MNTTVALTGVMPGILLLATLLTFPLSWFLLRLYRRAVIRSMSQRVGAREDGAVSPPSGGGSAVAAAPLVVETVSRDRAAAAGPDDPAWQQILRSQRRLAAVYTLAGIAYALVMASPWVIFLGEFLPGRFLWFVGVYAWPLIVALWLITPDLRTRLLIGIGYIGVLTALAAWLLPRSPDASLSQLVLFWSTTNVFETILVAILLARPVRAVGPLVLAFMAVTLVGAVLVAQLLLGHLFINAYVAMTMALGLDVGAMFILPYVFGFVLFGAPGWLVLCWLGRRYRDKRTSDQALTLDALWLMFGIVGSIGYVFEGWAWIFTGPAAFAVYKAAMMIGLKLLVPERQDAGAPRTLLVLRVFSLGSRSERLFDQVVRRWLHLGSIGMIAGPDLVTSTIEPHEFLAFVGGHLPRQFVQGKDDLDRRVREFDTKPDPDGRFRVNEFFCFADTWQPTMQWLSRISSVVLMDLRSFSRSNQGCVYEIDQLLAIVPLERVLFVVDCSTDREFLAQTLQDLWQRNPVESPNQRLRSPRVRLFDAQSGSAREARALLEPLLAAGSDVARPGG
ncbi:MAG TPA: hypothetical protein VKF40_28835 [Burkholderiales bacterium]|nr:hypothetical protein [Burkholderiales bacterium]